MIIRNEKGQFVKGISGSPENKFKKGIKYGSGNHTGRRKKVKKIIVVCKQCGKTRETYPSCIKQGRGKFCSLKCSGKWNGFLTCKGKNHYNWKGGISSEPYSVDWTETLRRSIRERDKYTCQICGKQQGDYAFDVHHIDYNKKNCNPVNLATLCHKCHASVGSNREKWMDFFSIKKSL